MPNKQDRIERNAKIGARIGLVCFSMILLAIVISVFADVVKFRVFTQKPDATTSKPLFQTEKVVQCEAVEVKGIMISTEYADLSEEFEDTGTSIADESIQEKEAVEETVNDVISCGIEPKFETDYTESDEYFRITAYCPCPLCCGDWYYTQPRDENGNIEVHTATDEIAVQGVTIATDWNVIPPETLVEIEDIGVFKVQDTGVVGNSIDIYFSNHEEALNFGLKYAKVRIVEG